MEKETQHTPAISRTALLKRGGAVAGTAAMLGLAPAARAATDGAGTRAGPGAPIEPTAGGWKTWVLSSGRQLPIAPPPGQATTASEIAHLQALAAQRDTAALTLIRYWDTGSPGYRWNEIALEQGLKAGLGMRNYRMIALVNVAIYDATVAAWNAKYLYHRPRPSTVSPTLTTVLPNPASPAYPCEHAVAAGAAATVLAYLFPTQAQFFAEKAAEAGRSRLLAGVQSPSDVAAGLELGRRVGQMVVARARTDGSAAKWTGTVPVGPGLWHGTPLEPTMGNWQTWVLASGSQFRPAPPPAFHSPERAKEIAEIKNYHRDAYPGTEIGFWPEDPAGRPAPGSVPISSNQIVFYYAPLVHLLWWPELSQKLFEYRLDTNPPRAARAYALVSIAGYDATVASWNGKYFYWVARPIMFDPTITTVLPTYPMPDYPSAHAATVGGTSTVLAYLFPPNAHFFTSRAEELAVSRIWAGIYFRSAIEAGLKQGRSTGQLVVARAEDDGAG